MLAGVVLGWLLTGDVGVLEVVANGKRCGSGMVALEGEAPEAIEAELLDTCGLDLAELPRSEVDGTTMVAVTQLGDGARARMDLATLRVDLEVPGRRWRARDLTARAAATVRAEEAPSLHLDVAPRASTSGLLELSTEAGLRAHGFSLSSAVFFANTTGVQRGLSRLAFDHQPSLLRVVAGDETVSAGGLHGAAVLGGVTLRHTRALDPERRMSTGLSIADVVETPSDLEVYVNDALVRRVRVEPGPFRVDDIARQTGPGEIRYVLRDAFGGERTVRSTYYGAAGLLGVGEHEASYSAGLVRNVREAWDYRQPALVANHRVGVSEHLTVGGHLEAALSGARGGPSFVTPVAGGALELALGLATSAVGPGAAGQISYAHPGRSWAWSSYVRVASPGYAHEPLAVIDDASVGDGPQAQGGAMLSYSAADWSISLEATGDLSSRGDALGLARLGASGNIGGDLAVYGGVQADTAATWVATVGLRWSLPSALGDALGGGLGASVDQEVLGNAARTQLRVDRRAQALHDWTASGRMSVDDLKGTLGGDAVATAHTPWGRASARALSTPQGGVEGLAELSTSLVAVWGGGLFVTAPGSQSYAVVDVPDQENVRVYLDHHPVGVTGSSGRLLVPGLRAYESARLTIAPGDISLDTMLAVDERIVAVPPRGAGLVRFPVRRAVYVRGVLVRAGAPINYGDVTATCGDARLTSPVGSAGAFELDTPPEGTCALRVVTQGATCRATIEIGGTEPLVDLGSVPCE